MTLWGAVVDHLWQSTLFAAVAGLATLALRRNRASARYALWLAASIKFLVPFAALMAVGAQFGPRLPAAVTYAEFELVIHGTGPTVSPLLSLAAPTAVPRGIPTVLPAIAGTIWLAGTMFVLAVWWIRWRRVAGIARQAATVESGRALHALRQLERAAGISTPIPLVESTASLEPGVFGMVRPILVWPRAIGERLDEKQIVTILAHEVSHVRRRDNLTGAIHMAVEAVFWFHPLVWWLGARLLDERERACDEAVLRAGNEPHVYAESILEACRTYLESPVACVSGVTGSNLSKRIERIMVGGAADALTPWKTLFVAAVPIVALVVPIVVGVLDAPRLRAESRRLELLTPWAGGAAIGQAKPQFEVASVKPNTSGMGKVMIQTQPGGRFTAENVTVRMLVRNAYQLQDFQLTSGPKWLDEDRFDIAAKAGDDLGDPFKAEQRGQPSRGQLMLRALLAERFKLEVHNEAREMPIYALVLGRKDGTFGSKLTRSDADCSAPDADQREPARPAPGAPARCGIRLLPGSMMAGGASMAQLANSLAAWAGRIVQDRTGLAGAFDFTLTWTPDQIPQGLDKKAGALGLPPIEANGPSIFTAVQEQLGLKLEPQRSNVDVLVIDRAEHPTEN